MAHPADAAAGCAAAESAFVLSVGVRQRSTSVAPEAAPAEHQQRQFDRRQGQERQNAQHRGEVRRAGSRPEEPVGPVSGLRRRCRQLRRRQARCHEHQLGGDNVRQPRVVSAGRQRRHRRREVLDHRRNGSRWSRSAGRTSSPTRTSWCAGTTPRSSRSTTSRARGCVRLRILVGRKHRGTVRVPGQRSGSRATGSALTSCWAGSSKRSPPTAPSWPVSRPARARAR